MGNSIRVKELPSKEVFVNVNDLIIELLIKAAHGDSVESKVYNSLVNKLTSLRDVAHKTYLKDEHKKEST